MNLSQMWRSTSFRKLGTMNPSEWRSSMPDTKNCLHTMTSKRTTATTPTTKTTTTTITTTIITTTTITKGAIIKKYAKINKLLQELKIFPAKNSPIMMMTSLSKFTINSQYYPTILPHSIPYPYSKQTLWRRLNLLVF